MPTEPRQVLIVLLMAVLLIAGLPMAEAHPEDEPASVAAELLDHSSSHDSDSVLSVDGTHVHLHQCCLHLGSGPTPALAARTWNHVYVPVVKAGDLLAGNSENPFRPPAA